MGALKLPILKHPIRPQTGTCAAPEGAIRSEGGRGGRPPTRRPAGRGVGGGAGCFNAAERVSARCYIRSRSRQQLFKEDSGVQSRPGSSCICIWLIWFSPVWVGCTAQRAGWLPHFYHRVKTSSDTFWYTFMHSQPRPHGAKQTAAQDDLHFNTSL